MGAGWEVEVGGRPSEYMALEGSMRGKEEQLCQAVCNSKGWKRVHETKIFNSKSPSLYTRAHTCPRMHRWRRWACRMMILTDVPYLLNPGHRELCL